MGRAIRLMLPYPPSVNNLYLNVSGRGRIPTKAYAAWRKEAGQMLLAQRAQCAIGPVEVHILVQEPNRVADIDGKIKAVLDCLVQNGIIASDCQKTVRKVSAQWWPGAGCEVEIVPATAAEKASAA